MLQKLNFKGAGPPPADVEKKQIPWQRLIVGTLFVSLGVTAAAVGIASIGYRFTNLVVDDGLINGRIVRIQAPISGNIEAFYAKPGASVKSGQVLMRIAIDRTPQEEQVRLQTERSQDEKIRIQLENSKLQGQVQANSGQLIAARQSLEALKNQLQTLERQYEAVQRVDVQMSSEALKQQQANVEAAVSKAASVRADYERYASLLDQGLVTRQHTDHLRSAWEAAEAEVKQAKAGLSAAEASLSASKRGEALSSQNSLGSTLADQRPKLRQAIEAQEMLVKTLEAQIVSGTQQVKQAETLYRNHSSLGASRKKAESSNIHEVSAVLSGVVYTTDREQGEQVLQAEPILTLLDCNDLWVETVVRADQASQIDTRKPVTVQLAGNTKTVSGEVDLVQPISSIQGIEERSRLMQVQALMPAIPPTLVGRALARVTVRIPPPPEHTRSQRFCGLGQMAQLTFSKKPFGSM